MDLREISDIEPMAFLTLEILLKKRENPSLSTLINSPYKIEAYMPFKSEKEFVEVGASYSDEGLYFAFIVYKEFEEAFFPAVSKGDGIEIFIDTRGRRHSSFLDRYSHHFVFLPKETEGVLGAEVTQFKTSDKHPHALMADLQIKPNLLKGKYQMEIFLPRNTLFGYDPDNSKTMRLAFKVHRGKEGCFEYPSYLQLESLESSPSLWASVELEE